MKLLVVALLTACLAALALGEVLLGPAELWRGLMGEQPGALVLSVLRGPRVATGALAGAALGLSGAIFQSLLRNPLAAPETLGFTSGAGLGALLAVVFGGVSATLGAAAGGLLAALVVGAAAGGRGGMVPMRLILIGIGVGFTLNAATGFLMTRLDTLQAGEAQRWLTGSLAARDWSHTMQAGLGLAGLGVFAAAMARSLSLLELGDELATGLGLHAQRSRLALAVLGVLLAASAVAVMGPVPFVALMAPPIARAVLRRTGGGQRLAAAALVGAVLTVLADLAARTALPGVQLPLGVMTGMLGAPYMLWLLSRSTT